MVNNKPITVVAMHVVPKSMEEAFKSWVREIDEAARCFAGYKGVEHIHSRSSSDLEHFCIFRFDTEDHLDEWIRSEARERLLNDQRSCSTSLFTAPSFKSMDVLFEAPERANGVPAGYKRAIVTFMVIWPLVHFVPPFMNTFISAKWLVEPLSIAIIVVLMTYIAMPFLTRLLAKWLYRT